MGNNITDHISISIPTEDSKGSLLNYSYLLIRRNTECIMTSQSEHDISLKHCCCLLYYSCINKGSEWCPCFKLLTNQLTHDGCEQRPELCHCCCFRFTLRWFIVAPNSSLKLYPPKAVLCNMQNESSFNLHWYWLFHWNVSLYS